MKKANQAGSGRLAYRVFQDMIEHVLGLRPQVSQAEYLSRRNRDQVLVLPVGEESSLQTVEVPCKPEDSNVVENPEDRLEVVDEFVVHRPLVILLMHCHVSEKTDGHERRCAL